MMSAGPRGQSRGLSRWGHARQEFGRQLDRVVETVYGLGGDDVIVGGPGDDDINAGDGPGADTCQRADTTAGCE